MSAAAADAKATLNDRLLCDFFVAVEEFRSRHRASAAGDWIRFSVPISLRQVADCRMPAANVVSMVFLDRTPAQIADPCRPPGGVHAEMDLIRRRQLGLSSCCRSGPCDAAGRVGEVDRPERCQATCVLSNLGRFMADSPLPRQDGKIVAGNVLLEGVEIFTPVRDGTAVTVAVVFYGGELHICMQYDAARVTEAQADDLMATYLRRIRGSTDMAGRPSQEKAA